MSTLLHYSVAGLPLTFRNLDPEAEGLACFAPFRSGAAPGPIVFSRDDALALPPDADTLHTFGFGEVACRFHFAAGRYFLTMTHPRAAMLSAAGTGGDVAVHLPDEAADPALRRALLRFALWWGFGPAALLRGALPLHASAVVHRGRAVLFLGESGTGKSTQSRLWTRFQPDTKLLNDDSPILRIRRDDIAVWGSPWSGKTPCYRNLPAPVAAIVRLRQAADNTIRPLKGAEALAALLPSCPPSMTHSTQLTERICDLLSPVVARTPVFLLACRPDREAVLLARDVIFGPVHPF